MTLYIIKTLLSAALIVLVTEVARRGGALAGLIAALPFTSLLAIAWMRFDSTRIENIATFSEGVVWFVLPSLPFFIALARLLRAGVSFGAAFAGALLVYVIAFAATAFVYFRVTGERL